MNIASNIICVQESGDTAKQLSERFGKIMQYRESPSINRMDTSISRSKQLETAVPPSTISDLSSGELVGMMSDTDQHIDSKTFHCEIINDTDALQKNETAYVEIPDVRGVRRRSSSVTTTRVNRMFTTYYEPKYRHVGRSGKGTSHH